MPELGEVVGANVRRLRGDLPMRALTESVRALGGRWSTGTLGDLESGRRRITVEDLVIAAAALSAVRGERITTADLLKSDDDIELTPRGPSLSAHQILELLGGTTAFDDLPATAKQSRDLGRALTTGLGDITAVCETLAINPGKLRKLVGRYGAPPEEVARIAKTMNMPAPVLHYGAALHYGRSLLDERDSRAGIDANAQRRGRATRELKAEIGTWIESRTHGDD
jgi:hypothetical protein